MCKHVAAVLYGIGARLDEQPELLFALRKVDQQDLIADGGQSLPQAGKRQPAREGARDRGSVGDFRHRDRSAHAASGTAEVVSRETIRRRHKGRDRYRAGAPPDTAGGGQTCRQQDGEAAERRNVGGQAGRDREAVKNFWDDRRKRAADAKPPAVSTTPAAVDKAAAKSHVWSGDRAAVSKRMKEYWAARRSRRGKSR